MHDIVTFGEAMLRLSPPSHQRLEQAVSLDMSAGGAEFNVAVACSRLGLKSSWISRLPDNSLGRLCRNQARSHGVDTNNIVWSADDRMGTYYVEFGASPRPNSVIYDRAHSAISKIQPGEINWKEVFTNTRHFHTTGITPALSDSAAEVTTQALQAAAEAGLSVSYDLNYRAKLWSQAKAKEIQWPLMEYVTTLLTTEEDTKRVFGIEGESYDEVCYKLADTFNFKGVCITLRENVSVLKNNWTAILLYDGVMYKARTYNIEVIDRVGAGDSLTGGLLSGLLTHGDPQKSLDTTVSLSALKQTIPGDLVISDLAEAEKLALSLGDLRIAR